MKSLLIATAIVMALILPASADWKKDALDDIRAQKKAPPQQYVPQDQPEPQQTAPAAPAKPAQALVNDEMRQQMATLPDAFARIAKILGCGHKYSEEYAADLFETIKGLPVVATGEVTRSSGGVVSLKVLPGTFTSDVMIKLTDARVAYDLEKGQRLSIRFTIRRQGGCFLPFSGDEGQIVRVLTMIIGILNLG